MRSDSQDIIVKCSRCGTNNRIRPHDPKLSPICAKCKYSLVVVHNDHFDSEQEEQPKYYADLPEHFPIIRGTSMDRKQTGRTWVWIIGIAVLVIFLGYWYWEDSKSEVVLLPGGKADFYRGGFFHRDKFELTRQGRKWHFWNSESLEGGELIVPFECPYNEYRSLRLEEGGRVYMVDRKSMTREELRVVNGEWSYDASDHWHSIFDLE